MKKCAECSVDKLFSEYNKCSRAKDGLQAYCRDCQNKITRKWKKDNRQHVRKYDKLWWKKHPALKAAKFHRNYERNKAKRHQQSKNWNYLNPEKRRMIRKSWQQRNKSKIADYQIIRCARMHNAPIVEKIDRQIIIERDNSTCYLWCKRKLPPHMITLDHVVPLSRGGTHTYDNLRVACQSCNSRKNAKLLEELDDLH